MRRLAPAPHQRSDPSLNDSNQSTLLVGAKNKTIGTNKQDERVMKTYKRKGRGRTLPVISEELIFEILVRLPAQTVVRFKSVCKAWNAIISDPLFVRMHLQQSTRKQEQRLSFLITPHTLDKVIDGEALPTTFSNNLSFYLWQEGQKDASLMHSTDFRGEFGTVYPMSHCDGLVLIPTDTKVYVLNPAIGDVLKLPDGHKDVGPFHCVGLGLDLRTRKYKVVRSFYRSVDYSKRTYDAGMEVFTIGGDNIDSCWRSTVNDPPYPIRHQIPKYFKGSVYWDICEDLLERPPRGLLKFSLEDETFSFICYPSVRSKGDAFFMTVIGGQLCLAQSLPRQIVIWVVPSGDSHRWVRLYVINWLETLPVQPLLGTQKDGILVQRGNYLYRYGEGLGQGREVVCVHQVTYKNPAAGSFKFEANDVYYFNITPYVESLVRVTTRAMLPAAVSAPGE